MPTQGSVTVLANGAEVDASKVALPMKTTHGRATTAVQPDAPTLEFTYVDSVAPCAVGDMITLLAKLGTDGGTGAMGTWGDALVTWGDAGYQWNGMQVTSSTTSTRFHGEVDTVLAIEVEGEVVEWEVRAIGKLADLGRISVRAEFPAQNEVDRVLAIAAKAGITIGIKGTSVIELAADELDRDCLDALHQVCASTGGLVWQDREGDYWYGTSNHREGAATWVLPAKAILDGIEWDMSSDQILNHLTIRYPREVLPPPPVTGEWTWSSNLDTGSDPGAGNIRANDVNSTQISTFAMSAMTSDGIDITLSVTRRLAGDRLYLQEKADSTKWALFTLTGPPVDNGDWFTISVDFKEHGDVGEPVHNNQALMVAFDSRLQGGERQETFSDEASMAQWGERHVEFSTLCANADEAGLLAMTILARRAQPFWLMPGVLVSYAELSPSEVATMQSMRMSDGILVPIWSSPSPTPANVVQWAIEGWVEEWREDGYWTQLALSDWARFSSVITRSYATVRDTMTYQQAVAKTYRELLVEVT